MQTPEEFAWTLYGEMDFWDHSWNVNDNGGSVAADLIRERDEAIRADERAKVLAGFTEVYALAWDGEPSMGGEPHRVSTGAELSEPDARRALATVGRRKPNARVERRLVGPWEPDTRTPEQRSDDAVDELRRRLKEDA